MEKEIKISIITASLNSGKTIEQAISSVMNQTYPNVEHVIIDGQSKDNTINIIRKYQNERLIWVSEKDNGIADAFNKGAKIATGDFVLFLGADDALLSPTIISEIASFLSNDVDILCCQRYTVNENTHRQYIYCIPPEYRTRNKYNGMMTGTEGMFVRRKIFLDKYIFDTSYKITMDHKFFLQCFYDDNINIKFLDVPVAFFSNGGVSSVSNEGLKEENRCFQELNLPFYYKGKYNTNCKTLKGKVNILLDKIGATEYVHKIYQNFKGEKHHCNNKICRWCGRYEE